MQNIQLHIRYTLYLANLLLMSDNKFCPVALGFTSNAPQLFQSSLRLLSYKASWNIDCLSYWLFNIVLFA